MDIHVTVLPPEEHVLPNGTAVFEVTIPELDVRQYLYLPFDEFHRFFNAPEGIEADLLVVAGIVYLVDQLVPRSSFPDNWTRGLALSIPVENPQIWGNVSESLADAFQFLTGDRWQFIFNGRQVPIYHYRKRRLRAKPLRPASTTCLFSGGLDSLVGAIDLLEEQDSPITLVSHYDLGSTAKRAQANLANRLRREYPWRINLIQARVGGVSHVHSSQDVFGRVQKPQTKESTFRSRSIVFLALGLYVARQHSIETHVPLLVPENGFVALNPPLTDARIGSCSTKTTHPTFLDKFQSIVEQLGIPNEIRNPFVNKSKGEVLAQALNENLVQELAPRSISCAHPTRRQGWYRKHGVMHCGYCVPCLIRRASLYQVGLDEGTDYGFDVWAGELGLSEDVAVDLRAILSWVYSAIYNGSSAQSIVKKMDLPISDQAAAQHVIQSGLDEMMQIISDKAEDRIKQWAGLETL